MAYVKKKFNSEVTNSSYEFNFKTLPPLVNFKYKAFILEIVLPMTGKMFDNSMDQDPLFEDKKTIFSDMFSHLATKLSDQRVINLLEDMLEGATYTCPITNKTKDLVLNEFFDGEFGLLDEIFIYLLEVNFKHLFTEKGILKLLPTKALGLITTDEE